MSLRPSSSPAHGRIESHNKKQQIFSLPEHGAAAAIKPKTPKLKSQSPNRDDSPKAVGRSARKLEAALLSARLAYEKEQQVMRQLQQEHQTQLHDLLKKRLEFEEELQIKEDAHVPAVAFIPPPIESSSSFDTQEDHEASPDKSKRGTLRVHLSPPPKHSPFIATAEHFDRQQSIYDAKASIQKSLMHSPLATSLLSSVKSRLDNTWLTKTDGPEASGVGKLAAHAREWCFPMQNLRGNIATATMAAITAASGEETEATFDSIFSAAGMTTCYQRAGLFRLHRLVASRGLLEVALAATGDETEQSSLHCVVASSEWHGGVAVTIAAYAQPCKFPAYALKFAAKLRCINFPRIEPFIGLVVNNERDCMPVASISVSEGVPLTEYLFKERHVLSFRDMIDLSVDAASALACVNTSYNRMNVNRFLVMLFQVYSRQRPQCWLPQLRHMQRGCFVPLQNISRPHHACPVLSRSCKQRRRWAALYSPSWCLYLHHALALSTQVYKLQGMLSIVHIDTFLQTAATPPRMLPPWSTTLFLLNFVLLGARPEKDLCLAAHAAN